MANMRKYFSSTYLTAADLAPLGKKWPAMATRRSAFGSPRGHATGHLAVPRRRRRGARPRLPAPGIHKKNTRTGERKGKWESTEITDATNQREALAITDLCRMAGFCNFVSRTRARDGTCGKTCPVCRKALGAASELASPTSGCCASLAQLLQSVAAFTPMPLSAQGMDIQAYRSTDGRCRKSARRVPWWPENRFCVPRDLAVLRLALVAQNARRGAAAAR